MPDQIIWTGPDGVSIDLTDTSAGFSVLAAGTSGLRSNAYEMTTASFASYDGTSVYSVKAPAREMTLGVLVEAAGGRSLAQQIRTLIRAMRPKAGMGALTASWANGNHRSIGCYCIAGLEGSEDADATLAGYWWKALLRFYAPDPWWQGAERTVRFGLGAPTAFFPIPPVTLSPSVVQGQFSVDLSDADTDSFPLWTITGPGSSLTLANRTSGRSLTVNVSLGAGESLTIDTRPGRESVRLGTGQNAMPAVAGFPDLWPLVEGVNDLSVTLSNATAATEIVGSYRPRYSGV